MKKRKRFIQIVCIALALLMVFSIVVMIVSPAYASGGDQVQDEIDELNSQQTDIQSRMDDIQAQINSLDYEKANTLEKKAILDRKNMLAQEELDVIQEQIDIIDGKAMSIQDDLAEARQVEERQRNLWLSRLRAMEERSDVGYLAVLFDATSFADLLTRLDLVNEVMAYDKQLESEYMAAREKAEALESEAVTMFQENAVRRTELQAKQSRLEADIAAACLLIEQMEQDSEDYEEILKQEAATQALVQSLIVQKEQELSQARAAEQAAIQGATQQPPSVEQQPVQQPSVEQQPTEQQPSVDQSAGQPPVVDEGGVGDAGTDTNTDTNSSTGTDTIPPDANVGLPPEEDENVGNGDGNADVGLPDTGDGEGVGGGTTDSGSSGSTGSTDSGSSGSSSSSGSTGSTAPSASGTWMMWPSYTRTLTDRFGPREKHPVTGQATFHYGVDVGAGYGSSIYAAASGTVIFAGQNGGYGNCVMINHGNGYTTLYGHMSSISVVNGQSVSQGQVIGLVGATGRVTGPHLHFEVRNSSGTALDPMSFGYY